MKHTGNGGPGIPAFLRVRNPRAWGGMKGRVFVFLQACYYLKASFTAHQGPLRAAALTYTTVLSLVPFLAIAFSVLKGLGVQHALEPLLREVAGESQEAVTRIIEYVNNTNARSLGAIGLLTLILTVVTLLESIEKAFNTTFGVRETRPLRRRISDYLSVVMVGPVLLLVATSMTSSLHSQWLVQWLIHRTWLGGTILLLFRLVPYVSVWVATVLLYVFIPNTRVRFRSAVLGGILAGTAWQIVQLCYFHFQVGVAKYNAIYGTMAAVPVFLVWIYTSWLIVLFGLEVVYAHQSRGWGAGGLLPARMDMAAREELALALLVQVNRHFRRGGDPPVSSLLAEELRVPLQRVDDVLEALAERGHLVPTAGSEPGWLPARDPAEVPVSEVLASLRGSAESGPGSAPALALAGEVIRRSWDGTRASIEGVTLHDLTVDGARWGESVTNKEGKMVGRGMAPPRTPE